ncbi:AI-2E family transporter [Occultella gossypii]|uniref:AI-2E family transporter n=1 Tax=Occultella gossypii TaxID=2800820 RepID=A0ABS7SBA2_9MICO|nr:AI-2E family transporter [Occultella gossypii]MBZ2196538.1 AI-2E family transporter [Occultella gossypii]
MTIRRRRRRREAGEPARGRTGHEVVPEPLVVDAHAPRGTAHLWTDRLGRSSIRTLQVMILIAGAAIVVLGLIQVKLVVIPLMVALILAAALTPVVAWLRRRGVPGLLATWLTLIGAVVVIGGVVTGIVFAVRNQWEELAVAAGEGLAELQDILQRFQLSFDLDWDAVLDAATQFMTSAQFGSGAVAGLSAVGQVITGLILIVVVLFFFLKDGEKIWNFFLTPLRGEPLARGERIGTTAVKVLGGYVRGTALVALVDAVAIGVGLAVLRVPLALPLAVVVFFGAFIPLVGATVAGIFAALVALVANGPLTALIVVILVIAVNQLEGDFLQPVVMGQSLKLHPLVILLSLTIGTILGGILGAILAVPVTAVGWAVAKIVLEPEREPTPEQLIGRRESG